MVSFEPVVDEYDERWFDSSARDETWLWTAALDPVVRPS